MGNPLGGVPKASFAREDSSSQTSAANVSGALAPTAVAAFAAGAAVGRAPS